MSHPVPKPLADMLGALETTYAPPPADERRRAPRVEFHAPLVIQPLAAGVVGEPLSVLLRDFSANGLGVDHWQPMTPGDQFVFHLPRGHDTAAPVVVTCTVARCERPYRGLYRIGVRFASVSNRDGTLELPHTNAAAAAAAA